LRRGKEFDDLYFRSVHLSKVWCCSRANREEEQFFVKGNTLHAIIGNTRLSHSLFILLEQCCPFIKGVPFLGEGTTVCLAHISASFSFDIFHPFTLKKIHYRDIQTEFFRIDSLV
jgi:hypothetical protein